MVTFDRVPEAPRPMPFDIPPALRRRAGALPQADRALLELSWSGCHLRHIAQLLGRAPGTVSRRIASLRRRLAEPIVRALLEHGAGLSDEQRDVGLGYFLHRRSIRKLAEEHELPASEVTRILAYVRGWAKGVQSARPMRAE